MKRLLPSNRVTLAATVAAAAGVAALAFVAANMAFSDEGSGVVDLAKVTTIPFVGDPTAVRTSSRSRRSTATARCRPPTGCCSTGAPPGPSSRSNRLTPFRTTCSN